MGGQPVTTNPFMIMLINMTIVFGVLWILGLVMNLIRAVDPTAKKNANPEIAPVVAAPAVQAVPAPAVVDDRQLTAVIMATLSAYGCGKIEITSIRPIKNEAWTQVARINSLRK